MDLKTERLMRRTAMVASVTAAYLLLTADYSHQAKAVDSIKRGIECVESSAMGFIFGHVKESEGCCSVAALDKDTASQMKEPEQHVKGKLK